VILAKAEQVMLNLILILIVAVMQGAFAQSNGDVMAVQETFNCYTDYLKKHGFMDAEVKTEPFDGESSLCEMILATTVNRIYGDLYKEFHSDKNFRDAAACIVQHLKASKWSELDIMEQIFEASTLYGDVEKEKKIRDIKVQQDKISSNSILVCLSEREFGELFDSIIGNVTMDDLDQVGDYCARKYGVDNNLIDTNVYKINLNPSNLVTTYIQCDIVNKKHFEEAEIELRKHLLKDMGVAEDKVNCYIEKYHENHYFDKTLAIALLGELKITDEQKAREKKHFVAAMTNITRVISEC
jgi:uncharacterized protein YdeI (BOF family)